MPIFYHDVPQYSEAYDRLKLGIPTGSNFHKIITPQGKPSKQWREYACVLIAERILQRKSEFFNSPAMERGLIVEAEAVDWYEFDQDVIVQRVGFNDIVWVRTAAPGISDPDALAWAARESRILLTFDKDFGELAKVSGLPAACGVILFCMPMPRPIEVGQRLVDLIMACDDWTGHFSVVEPGRVRLPALH
jgi:hypothetical protein